MADSGDLDSSAFLESVRVSGYCDVPIDIEGEIRRIPVSPGRRKTPFSFPLLHRQSMTRTRRAPWTGYGTASDGC